MAAGRSSDYGRLFFQAEVFCAGRLAERRKRPNETITEPARRVPVFRDCDVLVAGGGPSGAAAALAASRGCVPRAVPIAELQALLLCQGAWLRPIAGAAQAEAAK